MYFTVSKRTYYNIKGAAVIASWAIWAGGFYLSQKGYLGKTGALLFLVGFVPYILANVFIRYSENENT